MSTRAIPRRTRRARPTLRRFVTGQIRLAGPLLILWAGAFLLTGDHFAPVRWGVYAMPALMVLAWMQGLWAMAERRRLHALTYLGIGAMLFSLQAPPLLRTAAAMPAPPQDGLHVLSLSNRTMNRDMEATARFLRAEGADLAILQEVADPKALIDAVNARPGPRYHGCHDGTYAILSRHPVGARNRDVWHGALLCPVSLPGGEVWAGSIHLPRGVRQRREQDRVTDHLLRLLAALPGPKIIAGDFNSTPHTTPVRRMEALLINAHRSAGRGFGFTFPTTARRIGQVGPFLTIDYIFHSDAFRTARFEVLRTHPPMADHFPLRAVLARREDPR